MARMIPPRYDSQGINYGEKFLFQQFNKAKDIKHNYKFRYDRQGEKKNTFYF